MAEIKLITDINSKEIEIYKSMKDNLCDKNGLGMFVAEGDKVVRKLLNTNLRIHSILAKEEFYSKYGDIILKNDSKYYTAYDNLLKEIIGFRMHTGVMAVAYKPDYVSLGELSETVICFNGIVDSENVGSIIRNCAAFGINSIIIDSSTSSPYLRRAVRVSMGTVFNIKIYNSEDILSDLSILKESGYKIISAEIHKSAKKINGFIFPQKKIIIFGNESKGINQELLGISDDIIYIPITNLIESINVASSSAIILSRIMV